MQNVCPYSFELHGTNQLEVAPCMLALSTLNVTCTCMPLIASLTHAHCIEAEGKAHLEPEMVNDY